VPDVIGQRLADARTALESRDLRIAAVMEKAAPTAAQAGRVYRQDPGPDVEIPRGATVRVWTYGQLATPGPPEAPPAACDLAGSWTNRVNVTTTWTFRPRAPGSTTYAAEERGGCNARGTATLTGHTVRLQWSCETRFAGTYQWELDASCERGTGSLTHTGASLEGRRFASTITRVAPRSAGRPSGSDAERRLGPRALRFPAGIAGVTLNAVQPRNAPGRIDRSGLVARPARGWLADPARGIHAQMATYGSTLTPITLGVTWFPDPGQRCARPAFDVVTRTYRDPNLGQRPSSAYVMSLHPQGRAAHATLGGLGLTPQDLRRRIPEREAASILRTLLEQVAPYADACR
jgi:hypothetical protein